MQYIVLDMEWNQPWPGTYAAKRALPVKIRGEIIQIGAVRVTDRQIVGDEFQALIKPKYYRKLNKKVSSLTGIKDSQLEAHGIPFPEAMERFRDWCGDDCVFLTWGFDDIGILKENMALFGLDSGWVDRWYNAQMIFNAQTDGATAQKALKTAMQMAGVEASRPAHDALGDAYHTAILCTRLDLPRGMAEYDQAMEKHENGFHGAELPGCIDRKVFHGFQNRDAAMEALSGPENLCPKCGQAMSHSRWLSQQGKRYMTMAECADHGPFLVRVRLTEEEDGTLKASRLIYEGDSEAAKSYEKVSAKPKVRRRRRRAAKK
ncbi:MAG: exonuclease domain-containing protein [Candidatus Avoscillospira sp.]